MFVKETSISDQIIRDCFYYYCFIVSVCVCGGGGGKRERELGDCGRDIWRGGGSVLFVGYNTFTK